MTEIQWFEKIVLSILKLEFEICLGFGAWILKFLNDGLSTTDRD